MRVEGRSGPRSWAAVAAWGLWGLAVLGWVGTGWLDGLLREAGMAEAAWSAGAPWAGVVAALSAATVGAVIAGRRPRHPVGWLLLGLGLGLTYQAFGSSYSRYGLVARPGVLPGASYLAGFFLGTLFLYLACAAFVLLLTPTGSLPSPHWRWWARIVAGAGALGLVAAALDPRPLEPEYPAFENPLSVPALQVPVRIAIPASALILVLGLLTGAGSLVGRFRRARGVERQQLRWLAFGAGLTAVALLVALVALQTPTGDDVFQLTLGVCLALLPLATGAAILRYRLYDIDRIISRTVAYGLLTLVLGGGYAAVALMLGQLVGRDSSLAVAGATLAVAAVFRRVQAAVERRFNRSRHDAARIIEGFGARLRDQVDLDTLTAEVLAVADQTMQPTRASLWLRPPAAPAGR